MNQSDERQQQEYEYVMEGITTRMHIALEKMAESNRLLRSTVKSVCYVMLAVIIIIVSGFIVSNQLWISHINHIRKSMAQEVVIADEAVLEPGQGAGH